MARLNTTKPPPNDTRLRPKTSLPESSRSQIFSPTKQARQRSAGETRNTDLLGPGTVSSGNTGLLQRTRSQRGGKRRGGGFDIFSDADAGSKMEREGDEPRVSRGQDEDAGKTKSPLKMAKVNSLLLPVSQHHAQARSRLTRKSELDYDKENDIGEGEVEDSIIERADIRESLFRQSPGSEDGRQFMGFRDAGSETNGGRVSESEPEPESEPESGSEDNGFDSMDDFIVSDDEELSVHGTSEAETDHDEIQSSPLPPPLPPSPPKRRLFRGRRRDPKAEVENELESPSQKEEELPRLEQSRPDLTMPSLVSDLLPKEVSQDELNIDQEMERLSLENNDVSSQLERDLYHAVDGLDSSSQQTTDQEVLRLETPPPSSPSKGPVLSSTKRKTQIPPSPRSSSQQTTDHEIPRLETPPSSPSKRPILSPTKRKIQIPQSPHRESVDAFWNQEVTNDWVDQHSPRRLEQLVRDFEESDGGSPSDTMAKTLGRRAAKTPSKTALRRAETEKKKAQAARKKAFDNKKGSLAKDFLNVLDDAVSGGQVQRLAEGAGGVKIVWSKTLKKTAGRANWNGDRTALPGTSQATRYAAIELAERIIDDEDRLINTLAHEYCHLANFMISHIHNNPHGASFKHWGHKCKAALRDHPIYGGRIEVTTKHSYKIDFKYVWSCVDCSQTYGRHSKSINTARLRCAICRGVLQQIKPKPRNVSPRKQAPGEKRAVEDVARVLGEVSLHN